MGTIRTIQGAGPRRPTIGAQLFSTLMQSAAALAETFMLWQERARQRRNLSGLDDHLLKDIGISRADAEAEAIKSFWRS